MLCLLVTAECQTPIGVEHLDTATAQRQLTANALTTDEHSPSDRNVLRRWVLSERYDDDPAGAIAALHTIATDGRGDEDEVITLAEMSYLYAEKTHQRSYFLGAAIFRIPVSREGIGPAEPLRPAAAAGCRPLQPGDC